MKNNYTFWNIIALLFCPIAFFIGRLKNKDGNKVKILYTTKHIIYIFLSINIFFISIILIGVSLDNNSDSFGNYDNGYRTSCYTKSDGTRCCISCKKTSYGDFGCGRSCN